MLKIIDSIFDKIRQVMGGVRSELPENVTKGVLSSSKEIATSSGRVLQNWVVPGTMYNREMPILENPSKRVRRSTMSLKYFMLDDVCGPAIRALVQFEFGKGFDVSCFYASEDKPDWLSDYYVDIMSKLDAYSGSPVSKAVSEFIVSETSDLINDTDLEDRIQEMFQESLIHGDGYIHIVDNWPPETVEEIKKLFDNGDIQRYKILRSETENRYGKYVVSDLQLLNTTAVNVLRNDFGETIKISIKKKSAIFSMLGDQEVPLINMLVSRYQGPSYNTYGFPITTNALFALQVKEALYSALKAFGDRYALPVKLIKVGQMAKDNGVEYPLVSEAMLSQAQSWLEKYDPKQGTGGAVPFYWDLSYTGTEGKMPRLEKMLEKLDKSIITAMDIPATFLNGDWANYATAKVQFEGLVLKMNPYRRRQKKMVEGKLFKRLSIMRGWLDTSDNLVVPVMDWKDIDLGSKDSLRALIVSLLQLRLKGFEPVVSMKTARERLGFDNRIEKTNIKDEGYSPGEMDEDKKSAPIDSLSPKENFRIKRKENWDYTMKNTAAEYYKVLDSVGGSLSDVQEDLDKLLEKLESGKLPMETIKSYLEDFYSEIEDATDYIDKKTKDM